MLSILSRTLQAARVTTLRMTSPRRKLLRDIPPELYDYWARTAHHEFQGIPRDAFFYARAADALLMFFQCVQRSNRPCALPSKAADSVWHAWLRWSPDSLDAFCERHFGRRIPHVEAGDMTGGMMLPMAMSLVTARTLDGQALAGPHVPGLFAIDRVLRMPNGFAWQARGSWTVCSQMCERGRPARGARVHPAAEPDFLLAAGLIAQGDYDRWRAGCADGYHDLGDALAAGEAACDGDGGGDGGGDGSGGGSSCGGGCGGGGCGS